MAATKCVHAVMIMLLLNWRVCFANRAISDKNQEEVNKPEALNGAAGVTWSWGSNGGAGAAGIGFNTGGGSGTTPPGSGAGSGTGSGTGSGSGCGCGSGSTSSGSNCGSGTVSPGKGSGSCGSCGSGGGGSCPDQGGGCQGSVGIPSFVIPGFSVPIPLWGLYCTPIESCPAGNCGGIRLMFDYSQYAAASTNSTTTTTTTTNANEETKTQLLNQPGINDHYHNLTEKINGGSLPKDEEKRVSDGSESSDEAVDNHHHDQNVDALAPESI